MRQIQRRPKWQVENEAALYDELQSELDDMEADVIGALNDYDEMPPEESHSGIAGYVLTAAAIGSLIYQHSSTVGQQGRDDIVGLLQDQGWKLPLSPLPRDVTAVLQSKADDAAKLSTEAMSARVLSSLAQSSAQGATVAQATEALRAEFKYIAEAQLATMARTNIMSAYNQTKLLTEQEFGIEYHIWQTMEDDRVRGNDPRDEADHVVMQGQITTVGGMFSNGLEYPCDMNGDPAEWMNCRCTEEPFIMPPGMSAPGEDYFYESDLVEVPTSETP